MGFEKAAHGAKAETSGPTADGAFMTTALKKIDREKVARMVQVLLYDSAALPPRFDICHVDDALGPFTPTLDEYFEALAVIVHLAREMIRLDAADAKRCPEAATLLSALMPSPQLRPKPTRKRVRRAAGQEICLDAKLRVR
jgi:hypothetical protein